MNPHNPLHFSIEGIIVVGVIFGRCGLGIYVLSLEGFFCLVVTRCPFRRRFNPEISAEGKTRT